MSTTASSELGFLRTSVSHDRRLDVVRRHLFKFLSACWRPETDARESVVEIVHVRSGTPVDSMTLESKRDTPASVAQWAIDECAEFSRDCGEAHAQNFHVVLDDARHSIWIYPEGGDASGGLPEAVVDLALRHLENKESHINDMLDSTLKHQGNIIGSLTDQLKAKDSVIGTLMHDSLEHMKLYKELVDAKHVRDLEVLRTQKSEERIQLATDRFLGWMDKAAEVGGGALLGKLQQKVSEGGVLDQMAALLDESEQKALAALIARAAEKAKKAKALAESANGAPPPPPNGANGVQATAIAKPDGGLFDDMPTPTVLQPPSEET